MLPAATAIRKQGANKGATTAFLITTPETGIDSITVTYALLDPIMTVIRAVAAWISGLSAGLLENYLNWEKDITPLDLLHKPAPFVPFQEEVSEGYLVKIKNGIRYALVDVWGDIVVWFFTGLLIAGAITALVPEDFLANWLGGGISSMLIMLVAGVPLYICATASTPVAAALILKGVSPGAALVFLLVGPATNITSLTVLYGLLGKKSTFRYLAVIAAVAVFFGLAVDFLYKVLGMQAKAIIGEAGEGVPYSLKLAAAVILLLFSVKPLYREIKKKLFPKKQKGTHQVVSLGDIKPVSGSKGKK